MLYSKKNSIFDKPWIFPKSLRIDNIKQKNTMQFKHCLKILIDNMNSTGKVSHLKACRSDVNLTNKVKRLGPNKGIFSVEIASSKESSSSYKHKNKNPIYR